MKQFSVKATRSGRVFLTAISLLSGFAVSAVSLAQTRPSAPVSAAPMTGVPQRDTLMRFMRPVTIEFTETKLEDVMQFFQQTTGADMEVMWADDRHSMGLDKEAPITFKSARMTALDLLEKVLAKATSDSVGSTGSTWQMTPSGTMQIGPRERLNAFKRIELYPINDLLLEVPDYTQAPEFDLQSVLQSRRGGGGQSPFRDNQQNNNRDNRKPLDERVDDIKRIIIALVETEQWQDNGGDGASLTYYQGTFLVNAPDYVHRQLNGYPYWPSGQTFVGNVNGRRYVSLGVDTGTAKLKGFANQPVTGATPGNQRPGGDAGGPGGSVKPSPAMKPEEKKVEEKPEKK